ALGDSPRDHELLLERVDVHPLGTGDEGLPDIRAGPGRRLTQHIRDEGNLTPADEAKVALLEATLEDALPLAGGIIPGDEDHRHGIVARLEVTLAEITENVGEESVGDLHQDAGAITGAGIGTNAAAVGEVDQSGERLVDDLAGGPPVDVDDQADAAAVVIETR